MKRRLYLLVTTAIAAVIHNILHEMVHCLAAVFLNEPVAEFRLFTNGYGTSQVVFATPVADRMGFHWLVIAWLPSIMTVLIGYLIYHYREKLLGKVPFINTVIWFMGLLFLLLDPLYNGLLSIVIGGDVMAAEVVGWSPWPIRLIFIVVAVINLRLVKSWWKEMQGQLDRYRPSNL